MARINGEAKALADVRFKALGRAIGADRWAALGRMWAVWNECQERGAYVLSAADLDLIHDDIADFSAAVVSAGLGRKTDEGIYICGTRGRIEWLERKRNAARENGTKGGRPKKTNVGFPENQDGLPQESSPVTATCYELPATAVERETTATDARARGVSSATEAVLRNRVREIRQNESLMTMAVADPEAYADEVRTITGWDPDRLADLLDDDGIRPLRKSRSKCREVA